MKLDKYVRTDKYGERFVAGHRVPIQSVLWAHIEQGMEGKQLAKRFDTLSLEEIYGVLAYYYRNKDELDKYLRDTESEIQRQEDEFFKSHNGPSRLELKQRLRTGREREPAMSGAAR